MKPSISSKAFVALPTDRRTNYLQNRCSFMRGICTKKIGAISQLGAEKNTFPPKPGIQKDRQTYRQTDISFYRVALLLKITSLDNNKKMLKLMTLVIQHFFLSKSSITILLVFTCSVRH